MEIIIIIFGLIFGSFLNVLIYRLPLGISLVNPKRSICLNCNTQIKWYENIPIISYIFLRGKCGTCNEKISLSYPIVEFITAVITLLVFNKLGFNINFFITMIVFYTLIILSFVDFKYKAVPDYLLLIALIFSLFTFHFSLQHAMLFAGGFVLLNFFITFYIQNIKSRLTNNLALKEQTALGEGDIPIVTIIGGVLGIKLGLIAIFLSAIFAIVPSIYNIVRKDDIETPFIPYLVLGLFCCFIFDNQIMSILSGII